MARRLIAMGLCAALPVGAWAAPLVHVHPDLHHDDHRAAAVHAHFGGHHHGVSGFSRTADQQAVESHDDPEQTTRLQIFVAVASAPFMPPALPPSRFALGPEPGSVMRRPPDMVRSHGPPRLRIGPSRAPPALSVLI